MAGLVFSCSLPQVQGPERHIGGLQEPGAVAVLRASGAQRAAGGQMHRVPSKSSVRSAEGHQVKTIARHRVQLGRSSGRPRGTADEHDHQEDNRYGNCIRVL